MGSVNSTAFLFQGIQIPGARINPFFVGDLKQSEDNLLWREQ